MGTKRTYDNYKSFFDEVTSCNRLKKYHHSFILLYSFMEDRINRIYRDQYRYKNRVFPSKDDMKNSLYRKLCDIDRLGMRVNSVRLKICNDVRKRRNELVHQALFNVHKVSKDDVDVLKKFCNTMNKMRETQKRKLPKSSAREKLVLRFSSRLPRIDTSKMRKVSNPTSYPASKPTKYKNPYS